ncbi:hypothetical protein EDB87DRAFT_506241 [Lactarius vividus]|nr:hypothetical protein EDB87DRAFT_506241 [Lactarius vividus]
MTTSELTLSLFAWITVPVTMRDIPSAVSEQPSVENGKIKRHYICRLRKVSDEADVVLPVLHAHDTTGVASCWSRNWRISSLCSYSIRLTRCYVRMLRHHLLPHDPNDVLSLRGPSPLALHRRSPLPVRGVQCKTSNVRCFIVGRRQGNLILVPSNTLKHIRCIP